MIRTIKTLSFLSIISLALISLNCGPAKETQISQRSDAPDWVNKGSGSLQEKNILFGVGTSSVSDMTAARMQAGERARADIAAQIKVKVKSLSKNYTTAKSGTSSSSTTDVFSNVIENMVNQNVSGVSIVEYYNDPDAKVLYALAKLDLEQVKDVIDQHNEWDEATKKNVKSQMEDMFKELNQKTQD